MKDNDDTSFLDLAAADRARVDERLSTIVAAMASDHDALAEAVRYSLLGGGKRLRPLLCLWTHDALGGDARDAAMDAACAIECLHTYSLVHDDLPAMDDDDLRRGRPSSHVRFGEALAILVGDELLNLCYEVLSTIPARHSGETPERALDCVATLSRASGSGGLITGQALDLAPPDGSRRTVERIHANKTARLIAASMELGAILAGAGPEARDAVRESGTLGGTAFQITDDLLDLELDKESLGKTPGKDVESGKLTFPAVAGREESRAHAAELTQRALALLPQTPAAGPLRELVAFLSSRRA